MVFSLRIRDEFYLRMYNNVVDFYDCSLMFYYLYIDFKSRQLISEFLVERNLSCLIKEIQFLKYFRDIVRVYKMVDCE